MVVLESLSIKDFCTRAFEEGFPDELEQRFKDDASEIRVSPQEKASWARSLPALAKLLEEVPIKGHVFVEYTMPLGNRRADCILVGADSGGQTHVVVVELKQWSQGTVRLNNKFDMGWLTVNAKEPYSADHPCEQANVYRVALEHLLDFGISTPIIHSLAFLHEYDEAADDILRGPQFAKHLDVAVMLTRTAGRAEALSLLSNLKFQSPLVNFFASPKLKYSASFIANFSEKLNCSALFNPTGEQVAAFNDIAAAVDQAGQPTCVIVKGIVGTGKTVLAMLLIRHLMERGKQPRYHVRSAAIKACVGTLDFYSDGSAETEYLVVDEAHRLQKDRLHKLLIKKKLAVFFIDDNQWLHPDETCRSNHISEFANAHGMNVIERTLNKQLRCRDADGYLGWVDAFLNKGKLRPLESTEGFEVRLVDSPEDVSDLLTKRAEENYSCRIVGGYCWAWSTYQTPGKGHDIEIGNWRARWNANGSYAEWNRGSGLHEEVGAIYSVQGFEYDYVGVLIGDDLIFTENGLRVKPSAQQYKQLKDSLKRSKVPKDQRDSEFSRAIRNIYYVLLTRGKRGVFIYASNPGLQQELKRILPS
jgi:uncharacterized protein